MKISRIDIPRNFNTILVVCIGVIIIATLAMAIRVYNTAANETRNRQGALQLEMARAASLGIQYFLTHLADELKSLSKLPGIQYFEPDPLCAIIDHFYRHANPNSLRALFVVNESAQIVHSTDDSLPAWLGSLMQNQLDVIVNDEQRDETWVSDVRLFEPQSSDSLFTMVMLTPLVQDFKDRRHPNPSNQVVGMVGCIIDINWLFERFIQSIQVGKSGFAWVMDSSGRLLFHPRHSDMILRSIKSADESCRGCHKSFAPQIAMIENPGAYQEYQVADEPAKILTQASMEFAPKKWLIAVSIDLDEVTAVVSKNFRLFFWLVGLVLTGVITGGLFLLYFNVRRARAEALSRHSEEKQLLQEQIHNSAKLASIGELVDSVAHEINTPMTVISTHVNELLLQAKKVPYQDVLNIILDQIRRISKYTKSLLRYSRGMKFNPEFVNLGTIIEECLTLLGHRFRAQKIVIHKNWPVNLPRVKVDRDQMQQVILNLLNNAADALNGNGEIRIKIQKRVKDDDASWIEMAVCDNGHGIDSENLQKLFNPFFSTKPPEKGTGLGLSISRAIVERHGGQIKVESELGKGSCFVVCIPADEN